MNIEYFETPVPYIIVRNWFNEQELEQVWEELQFLTYGNKLRGPILTNSAKTVDGQIKKHNHGLFLDEAYTDRSLSNILTVTRKLWNPEFLETIEKHHFVFKYLKKSNQDSTLMSYYEDGDYYLPHNDTAILTVLINLYKEPKQFSGGDLQLENSEHIVPLENNRLVMFPSVSMHAVTPITFVEPNEKFSGNGRYTITQFITTAIGRNQY
jgi:Rps23 Pro-64 3,4-dihydroxylase Tpa1-like proline 4-hydroxylase